MFDQIASRAYASEEGASQDGYVWDDDFERWLEIPIENA